MVVYIILSTAIVWCVFFPCRFFLDGATAAEHSEFLKEIDFMKNIGVHRNIITMIACCTKANEECLVEEFAQHGDLLRFLKDKRGKVWVATLVKVKQKEVAGCFVYRICFYGIYGQGLGAMRFDVIWVRNYQSKRPIKLGLAYVFFFRDFGFSSTVSYLAKTLWFRVTICTNMALFLPLASQIFIECFVQ